MRTLALFALTAASVWAQEASSGLDLHGTISGLASFSREFEATPRNGVPFAAGIRAVVYPTWKINGNWTLAAAVQAYSEPYFPEQFNVAGYRSEVQILQLHLTYSRLWNNGSFVFRAGQLPPAFGLFQTRYDDAVNPLIGGPWSYGYYGKGVTLRGLPSVQVEGTFHKLDGRVQLANSSPANPRTLLDRDQYGSWIGGVGYTIMQGFRIGASAYRGSYLSHDFPFYSPNEDPIRGIAATGLGAEIQWAGGPWSALGEIQNFRDDYRAIPMFKTSTGYGEVRRTLTPRWFAASRVSYVRQRTFRRFESYEFSAGYQIDRNQLLKFGYAFEQGVGSTIQAPGRFQIQYVAQFRGISLAHN